MIKWVKVIINGDIDIAHFSKQIGIRLGFKKTQKISG
jgi:thiamine monophosphate synthase